MENDPPLLQKSFLPTDKTIRGELTGTEQCV